MLRKSYLIHFFSVLQVLISSKVEGGRFDPRSVKPLGKPPDRFLNVSELIQYHGYRAREYEAVTEDGYIIGLTRIGDCSGPPVLFVHGLGISTEMWVLHGPGHDLTFVLSNLGYDVWIGAQRGLYGSLKHTKYHISQPEFWDFSHDESGAYDLPAMIDLILTESGHTKTFYVGNSLGGAFLMAMCSKLPEYCSSVAGNAQYVPAMIVPRWEEFPVHTRTVLNYLDILIKCWKRTGNNSVFVRSSLYMNFAKYICGSPILKLFCKLYLKITSGFLWDHFPQGWESYSLAYSEAGTSVRQVQHLLQLARKGGSWMYDFGKEENLVRYGSTTPPSYNLSRLTSPTAVFYATHDNLITLPAMQRTLNSLGNLKLSRAVTDSSFGHVDFDFGKDVYKLVYSDIVDFFDSISGLK